jgi:FMN phosphatase YigB (HAD superfamily)
MQGLVLDQTRTAKCHMLQGGNKPQIRLFISDLDNTLYDWVSFFVPAFYAMANVVSTSLGITVEQMLNECKEVHQSCGSAEYPFALLKTRSVLRKYPGHQQSDLRRELHAAFDAFNRMRREQLVLYPGVRETLHHIKLNRVPFVAFTEAAAPNGIYRLNALEVLHQVDYLYAPHSIKENHPDPERQEFYRTLAKDKVRPLDAAQRKPAPDVLKMICSDFGVRPDQALYVGDSLPKDIAMAKEAGIHSALAKYGQVKDPTLLEQLEKITHRKEADVAKEHRLNEECSAIVPEIELLQFSDLLCHFCFYAHR